MRVGTRQHCNGRRQAQCSLLVDNAPANFAGCGVRGRVEASPPLLRRQRHRGQRHAPSSCATAERADRASRCPPAPQRLSPREGRIAQALSPKPRRPADQGGCRPLLTSSRWPSGSAFVELAHRALRGRQNPSGRTATFQYVLIAVSKRNSSVKMAPKLSLPATLPVSCGAPRIAGVPHTGLPGLHARRGAVTVAPGSVHVQAPAARTTDTTANPWSVPCKR
jgi:hypothetical protein